MFAFFILEILELFVCEVCKFLKLFTCLTSAYLKSKRCFNVKSSTNYFHMKTKILSDWRICISIPLRFFRVLTHIVFNIRYFRLRIFQPCYGTQRNYILAETGTQAILWKFFLWDIVSRVCKFIKKWNEFSKGLTLSWLSFWNVSQP